jgi:hypothetical protein
MSKYNVTKDGVVTNTKTGRVMKAFKNSGKWVTKAHGTNYYTHRMMWEQYFGPVGKDEVVMFKDDNPDNLSLDNLYKTDRFAIYDRISGDYPFCTVERLDGWDRFTCKYNGKILVRTTVDDFRYKTKGRIGEKIVTTYNDLTMGVFYDRFALPALQKVIPNKVVPLWGFEGLYEVHTNSRYYGYSGGIAVIKNLKTGRWTCYNDTISTRKVSLTDAEGKSRKIDPLVYVWNSLNPNDLAKEVDFRSPNKGLFFDLVKIR